MDSSPITCSVSSTWVIFIIVPRKLRCTRMRGLAVDESFVRLRLEDGPRFFAFAAGHRCTMDRSGLAIGPVATPSTHRSVVIRSLHSESFFCSFYFFLRRRPPFLFLLVFLFPNSLSFPCLPPLFSCLSFSFPHLYM